MGEHTKGDLENEASCRIAEAGGSHAGGIHYRKVRMFLRDISLPMALVITMTDKEYQEALYRIADMLPICKDGTARDGTLDRLGRLMGRGRGLGVYDGLIRMVACNGAIAEDVPVALKGCNADGYGNRDVTMLHELAFETAKAGIPQWVMLLRGTPTNLEMRRIDMTGVLLAHLAGELPEGTVKVRDDRREWVTKKQSTKADSSVWNPEALVTDKDGRPVQVGGWENMKDYSRLRIEWARLKNARPDLFLDADFIPFKAELPIGL